MKKGKALEQGGFVSGNIHGTITSIVHFVTWILVFYLVSFWLKPFALAVLAFAGLVLLIDIFTVLGIISIAIYSRWIKTTRLNYHKK